MAKRNICLPPELVDKIKKADLANKSPEDRRFIFNSLFGEEVGLDMSRLFNKSLLYKNQENALSRFIKNADLKLNPEEQLRLKQEFAQELKRKREMMYDANGNLDNNFIDSVPTDSEIKAYAQKILDKKYKIDVPEETVAKIMEIKKVLPDLRKKAFETAEDSPERLLYGVKSDELRQIVSELNDASKIEGNTRWSRIKSGFTEPKIDKTTGKVMLDKDGNPIMTKSIFTGTFNALAEGMDASLNPLLKSIKASLDNSGMTRQGFKIFTADPKIWAKQYGIKGQSWKTLGNIFDKKELEKIELGWRASTMSKDLYDDAINSGLAIMGKEDYFPNSWVDRIPGVGKFFKGSDIMYTMGVQTARMDFFEKYVRKYVEANGVKPSADVMEGFARVANSVTGRGGLGALEPNAGALNKLFFSARYQTAQLNTFKHAFDTTLPIEARKIARVNLARDLVFIGGLMATASLFGEVGVDPREKTFGKVRLFNSNKWIDLTAGQASYIVAAFSTLAKGYNYASGGKTKYGQDKAFDILTNFMTGKSAPIPSAVFSFMKEQNFNKNMPRSISFLENTFLPITIQSPIDDWYNEQEANTIAVSWLLDAIGTGSSQPKGSGIKALDLLK